MIAIRPKQSDKVRRLADMAADTGEIGAYLAAATTRPGDEIGDAFKMVDPLP
jgi:hypothetical protein